MQIGRGCEIPQTLIILSHSNGQTKSNKNILPIKVFQMRIAYRFVRYIVSPSLAAVVALRPRPASQRRVVAGVFCCRAPLMDSLCLSDGQSVPFWWTACDGEGDTPPGLRRRPAAAQPADRPADRPGRPRRPALRGEGTGSTDYTHCLTSLTPATCRLTWCALPPTDPLSPDQHFQTSWSFLPNLLTLPCSPSISNSGLMSLYPPPDPSICSWPDPSDLAPCPPAARPVTSRDGRRYGLISSLIFHRMFNNPIGGDHRQRGWWRLLELWRPPALSRNLCELPRWSVNFPYPHG